MELRSLPRPAVLLGLSGITPQALCLAFTVAGGPYRWAALAAGCFYAAMILSFLGGLWWMAALGTRSGKTGLYVMAVLPTLCGWAALLPWVVGWRWPGPSLVALGLLLLASPLADRRLAGEVPLPPGWVGLRFVMASALGVLTMALAVAGW